MTGRVIVCPLCRSDDVDIVANIPWIILCKCRQCLTAFTIMPTVPVAPS